MAAEDVTAWTKAPHGYMGDNFHTSTMVGAASAKAVYFPVITFMAPSMGERRIVTMNARVNAVTGTNMDIVLYGAMTSGGTKFILKDAVIADLTKSGTVYVLGAQVDLNAYPAPFYYIGVTFDVDEKANTLAFTINVPAVSL